MFVTLPFTFHTDHVTISNPNACRSNVGVSPSRSRRSLRRCSPRRVSDCIPRRMLRRMPRQLAAAVVSERGHPTWVIGHRHCNEGWTRHDALTIFAPGEHHPKAMRGSPHREAGSIFVAPAGSQQNLHCPVRRGVIDRFAQQQDRSGYGESHDVGPANSGGLLDNRFVDRGRGGHATRPGRPAGAVPPGTGSITGTVTVSGTLAPAADVCVSAEYSDETYAPTVMTAANGTYTIPSLAAGTYYVTFFDGPPCVTSAPNYADTFYNGTAAGTVAGSGATVVTVVAGTPTPGIDGQMSPGGAITGTVTSSASGATLAGACVEASSRTGVQVSSM